jgi:hypothetical protein
VGLQRLGVVLVGALGMRDIAQVEWSRVNQWVAPIGILAMLWIEVEIGREVKAATVALRARDEPMTGAIVGHVKTQICGVLLGRVRMGVVGETARVERARMVGAAPVANMMLQRLEMGLESLGDQGDPRRMCRAGSMQKGIVREETLVSFGTVERSPEFRNVGQILL